MTNSEFTAWLYKQNAIRCILIEAVSSVSGVETTRYLSSAGYVTAATDTPANTAYLPIVMGNIQFTESLDIERKASLSFGDIALFNTNGVYDSWLDDVWTNRELKIYIGDVQWVRPDFRLIFSGITANIKSTDRDTLSLSLRDRLQLLNTPVTEATLGGTSINQDRLLPLTFGECFNVPPLLIDESLHKYQVHNGPIESIIEVRDNGVPVPFTADIATGTFVLNQAPAGTISCSVQGDKPLSYVNNIADTIQRLVTSFGKSSTQLSIADIDTANFSNFATFHSQPVGLYLSDRTNVLSAIYALADSLGSQPVMNRAGLLQILQIYLPVSGTPTNIGAPDMQENSLTIESRVPVKAAIKIGFCKNWLLQDNLKTGIPEEHKDFFSEQFIYSLSQDATTKTLYKLDSEPVSQASLLLVKAHSDSEATRLLNLYKTQRVIYTFEGYAPLIELSLGDPVTITHPRFGLSAGKTGMVVKLQFDLDNFTVRVGVII